LHLIDIRAHVEGSEYPRSHSRAELICHVLIFMKLVKLIETDINPAGPSWHMASTRAVNER
jgi:hypothetical protein